MGFQTRTPTSNATPTAQTDENKWVAESLTEGADVIFLLLNDLAKRCGTCTRPTLKKYLQHGGCPDCRGVNVVPLTRLAANSMGWDYSGDGD